MLTLSRCALFHCSEVTELLLRLDSGALAYLCVAAARAGVGEEWKSATHDELPQPQNTVRHRRRPIT